MRKIILLLLSVTVIASVFAQFPVTAVPNVFTTGGAVATSASIASTNPTSFKLSIQGNSILWGTGVNTATSPTLYFRNTTPTTGGLWALNSDNTGLFTISNATGTPPTLGHTNRLLINAAGNMGLGTIANPAAFTSLLNLGSSSANSKFAVWDNATIRSGFGWATGQFRMHLSATTDKFSFLGAEAATTGLMTILGTGNVGIGEQAPTAALHIKAGTNTNAPLKLNSSTPAGLLTTAAAGAMEYDGTNLYFTPLATRKTIAFNDFSNMTALATTSGQVLKSNGTAAPTWVDPTTLPSSGWGLVGNTNATATSFIGTAAGNNFDLVFRRNGAYAGKINSSLNLTTFGLYSGNDNITGANNSFFGNSAGAANTAGSSNSFFGNLAGASNISGSYNMFIGQQAGYLNTTGYSNSFIGFQSGLYNSNGFENTFLGYRSGYNTTTGFRNTANGGDALFNINASNNNTAIGFGAGKGIVTGNANTIIGANIALLPAALSNNIIIADGDGNRRINVNDLGNVGIGTISPTAQLHTTGTVKLAGLVINATAPRVLVSDVDGNIGFKDAATIGGSASQWTTGTNNISYNTGLVLIGTAINPSPTDAGLKLAVSGSINAKKVKVTQLGWADYVFAPNYKLPTLTEVEKFIQANKHLPSVLSAAEVEKNGIDLGDNQATLLQKIEELTLYAIDANKKIEQQQAQINLLLKQAEQIKLLQEAVKKMQTNK
jgi:trimeric autotransporter adhesin